MNTEVMFSSKSDLWSTPQALFDELDKEFHFTLDPCADETNHKCDKYFTEKDDGLKQDWTGEVVFVNPPYSKVKDWIRKAAEERLFGVTSVCLVPARVDTKWFHGWVWCEETNCTYDGVEIRFIKGRLRFGDSKNSAPFPSCILIFRGE